MKKQYLNGKWSIWREGEFMCDVSVPGSVISGLYASGKIPCPYAGEKEYEIRDLFWKDYEFVRKFELTKEALMQTKLFLVCESLDTLAKVYINGFLVGETNNMHRTYRIPLENYGKEGENEICICFQSVLRYIKEFCPPENRKECATIEGCIPGNQWLRKAHSMMGWDWGPQTVDAGILRDIYLLYGNEPEIEEVKIRQKHRENEVTLSVKVRVSEADEETKRQGVRLELTEKAGTRKITALAQTEDGYWYHGEILIKEPKLWWPNGYGEQPLYVLCARTPYAEEKKTIGLRTITVSREKDVWGEEFAFVVNGKKIFYMGGNYVPEDAVYPWIEKEKTRQLLMDCKRVHHNGIRVWGGGYYPSDYFYDLCDEFGLIVWQDLMFACNIYGMIGDMEENCRCEVRDNVRRLRHHASLGLWCGNNELEWKWDAWEAFRKASPVLRGDYLRLFEYVIPNVLRQEDDQTFFWPSSPSSGGSFDDANAKDRGDTHYWDVWHGRKPFSDYLNHYFRFCSEFGFQSFPCMKTVETYAGKDDWNIFSPVMESHQKNNTANETILYYISQNFRYPKDFSSLLYCSQVLQGMAIKAGIEHWRRNRGRCMGAIYWQINDNWPVASWSGIDYYGRWKALHYLSERFFAPLAISIQKEEKKLRVWVENETAQERFCRGVLRFCRMGFDEEQRREEEWISVPPYASVCVMEQNVTEYENDRDLFAEAEVVFEDGSRQKETEVLLAYKRLDLKKPTYEVQVEETEKEYEIRVKSDTFAPFVQLDFSDADVVFERNFFSISKKEGECVVLKKQDIRRGSFAGAEDVKRRLQIVSLADCW